MKIGAMIFATDQTLKMTLLAPELEARGFESLWLPEKTHLPVSRRTPWPGGELPEWYRRTCDPMIALAAAAGVTERLRLGTGVSLLALHDPVTLGKAISTLDWMSDGRFEFGIGYGWNAEEFATHNVPLGDSAAIVGEKFGLMNQLWSHEISEYSGRYVALEPSWSWPKPVQQPGPPIHIGARASQWVFADIASFGQGWLPIEGYGDVLRHLPRLHRAFEAAGRSASEAIVSVYSSAGDPETLAEYEKAGVQRVIVTLPAVAADQVMRELDSVSDRLSMYLS